MLFCLLLFMLLSKLTPIKEADKNSCFSKLTAVNQALIQV